MNIDLTTAKLGDKFRQGPSGPIVELVEIDPESKHGYAFNDNPLNPFRHWYYPNGFSCLTNKQDDYTLQQLS
jgi:hypothetical protein